MTESEANPTTQASDPTAEPVEPAPVVPERAPTVIQIYCCPQGHWYGADNVSDLSVTPNIRSSLRNLHTEDPSEWGKVTGYRDECQECKQRGEKETRRVLVEFWRKDTVLVALAKHAQASA